MTKGLKRKIAVLYKLDKMVNRPMFVRNQPESHYPALRGKYQHESK